MVRGGERAQGSFREKMLRIVITCEFPQPSRNGTEKKKKVPLKRERGVGKKVQNKTDGQAIKGDGAEQAGNGGLRGGTRENLGGNGAVKKVEPTEKT